MNNFTRAHNSYLEPPDDPPVCDDGCGDSLERGATGEWVCVNTLCPTKFDGDAKELAAMLIEANETITYLREQVRRLTLGLKK